MPRPGLLSRAAVGVALLLIAAAAVVPRAAAAEVPSPWSWTNFGPDLRDVSCAGSGDCVAVGQQGMILRSTPGPDQPLDWSRIPISYPEELDGVTCSKAFCLAVSSSQEASATSVSKVFRSEDGGEHWSDGVELPQATIGKLKTRVATAIACSGGDCVTVGPDGGLWRSDDGGRKWAALDTPAKRATYSRVACPDEGVCVAVGGTGKGDESSVLIDGAKVTEVKLPAGIGAGIGGLACDTAKRCIATDGLGKYTLLSIPEKKWGPAVMLPKAIPAITAITCPIEGVCIGLSGGLTVRTTNLGDAAPKWERRPLGSLNLGALDCTRTDCVAVGKKASWFVDFKGGQDFRRLNEVGKFSAIDCPAGSDGTCAAGGEETVGLTRSGGRFWSLPLPSSAALSVKAINCTASAECLILGKNEALFTDDFKDFAGRHSPIDDPKGTDAQTCITREVCVGVNGGVSYTTFDGAKTAWSRGDFRGGKPAALACVPARLGPAECLAVAEEFLLLGTMTREDGKVDWDWRFTDAEPEEKLAGVGCAPSGACYAVGAAGEVLKSDGTDLMHWTEFFLPSSETVPALRPDFATVTCPADGVCLVGGTHGDKAVIASTTNDWGDYSLQEIEGIQGAAPTVEALGCETAVHCVGVGGTSLVGVRDPANRSRR